MRITSQQMHALDLAARQRANRSLVEWLKRRYPEIATKQTDAVLLDFVASHRQRAGEYGVEREDNIALWLDLVAMYGMDFDHQRWARPVLQSKLHGPDKMALLRRVVENAGVELHRHA